MARVTQVKNLKIESITSEGGYITYYAKSHDCRVEFKSDLHYSLGDYVSVQVISQRDEEKEVSVGIENRKIDVIPFTTDTNPQ